MLDSWTLHLFTSAFTGVSATLECNALAHRQLLSVFPFKIFFVVCKIWSISPNCFHAAGNVCRVLQAVFGQCVVGNLLAVSYPSTQTACAQAVLTSDSRLGQPSHHDHWFWRIAFTTAAARLRRLLFGTNLKHGQTRIRKHVGNKGAIKPHKQTRASLSSCLVCCL